MLSPWPLLLGVAVLTAINLLLGFVVAASMRRLGELRRTAARLTQELQGPLSTILVASHDLVAVSRELGSGEGARLARMVTGEAQRANDIVRLVRSHPVVAARPVPAAMKAANG